MPQTLGELGVEALALPGVLIGVTLIGAVWLAGRGVFSARAFAHAPSRSGDLTYADLIVPLGLWLVGGGLGAQIAVALAGEVTDDRKRLLTTLGGAVGVLPMVAFILWRSHTALRDGLTGLGFGLRRPGGSMWAMFGGGVFAVIATLATLSGVNVAAQLLGFELPTVAHDLLMTIVQTPDPAVRWGLIAVACLFAPFVEELLFRGLFQTVLSNVYPTLGRWTVILIAAGAFTLIHAPLVPWPALIGLAVLAVALGYQYERTGRLWWVIVVHAVFNAANVAIAIGPAGQVAP